LLVGNGYLISARHGLNPSLERALVPVVGVLAMSMPIVHVIKVVAVLLARVPAGWAVHVLVLGVHRIFVHARPSAVSVPIART
jgi:hypothetical protein